MSQYQLKQITPLFCPPQPASVAALLSFMTAELYSAAFHFIYKSRLECVNVKNNLDALVRNTQIH